MVKKRCKKCNEFFLESDNTFEDKYMNLKFDSGNHLIWSTNYPYNTAYMGAGARSFDYSFEIKIWICPNCKHEELEVSTIYGKDTDNDKASIGNIIVPLPEVVPHNARSAFKEACQIVDLSPKASATLSRKTLELMIIDFFDKKSGSLFEKIESLHKDGKIDEDIYNSMTGLRLTGNLGAHESTEKIIDIKPGEAQSMIELDRLLADEWYVAREKRSKLLKRVQDTGTRIKEERRSK